MCVSVVLSRQQLEALWERSSLGLQEGLGDTAHTSPCACPEVGLAPVPVVDGVGSALTTTVSVRGGGETPAGASGPSLTVNNAGSLHCCSA